MILLNLFVSLWLLSPSPSLSLPLLTLFITSLSPHPPLMTPLRGVGQGLGEQVLTTFRTVLAILMGTLYCPSPAEGPFLKVIRRPLYLFLQITQQHYRMSETYTHTCRHGKRQTMKVQDYCNIRHFCKTGSFLRKYIAMTTVIQL